MNQFRQRDLDRLNALYSQLKGALDRARFALKKSRSFGGHEHPNTQRLQKRVEAYEDALTELRGEKRAKERLKKARLS